jgi:hypothetical protein
LSGIQHKVLWLTSNVGGTAISDSSFPVSVESTAPPIVPFFMGVAKSKCFPSNDKNGGLMATRSENRTGWPPESGTLKTYEFPSPWPQKKMDSPSAAQAGINPVDVFATCAGFPLCGSSFHKLLVPPTSLEYTMTLP